jgi:O-antigen/teichoic acid export membrane protein
MSLKRNILANYVGQLYVIAINILLVPLYVKYIGIEAYGVVGFYAMLQGWFILLDMGLTPTMAREAARFNGGETDALSLRRLLRSLEGIFFGVALLGTLAMVGGANFIASSWLKVQELSLVEVQNAVVLMAIMVGLRWVGGLYRGAINGFEQMVWLNGFNIIIATLRFALIIPYLAYVSATLTDFFAYQLVVAMIEAGILILKTYRLLPRVKASEKIPWTWKPLREVLNFSLTIAFTSAVWVMVTQTDKLLLSGLISLTDYSSFTMAVLAASGIMVISGPVSGALLPRMTKLNAEGKETDLIQLYRSATQMVAIFVIPAAFIMGFFSEQVLWAWTGDVDFAHKASPVLTLYAIGNGVLALAAFPYYLQFAKGDLKLHLIGNALFVIIFIPLLILAVRHNGMVGAGYAWLIANLIPFIVWLPLVHKRFVKGLHTKWLLKDILPILLTSLIAVYIMQRLVVFPNGQLSSALYIGIMIIGLYMIAAISSSWVRDFIRQLCRKPSI